MCYENERVICVSRATHTDASDGNSYFQLFNMPDGDPKTRNWIYFNHSQVPEKERELKPF